MQSYERLNEPPPDVLRMVGLAVGLWAVIGMAAAGMWPRQQPGPPPGGGPRLVMEAALPALVYAPLPPELATRPMRAKPPPAARKVKAQARRRGGPSLAMRVFSSRNAVN